MKTQFRATVELYDGWRNRAGAVTWRLNAMLYHPNSGTPREFSPKLVELLNQAQKQLKASGVRYWYNSVRICSMLVMLSVDKQRGLPHLYPCLKMVATTTNLYRVFLGPEQKIETTCYQVNHSKYTLLESLTPIKV